MQTSLEWLFIYPKGMEKIVTYIKERFNNIPMFITENGEYIYPSLLIQSLIQNISNLVTRS